MDHGTVLRSAPEKQVDNVEYNEHTEFTVMAIRGDNLDPNAEKKLVRKIDLFLLPCIWIVYLLSYMV